MTSVSMVEVHSRSEYSTNAPLGPIGGVAPRAFRQPGYEFRFYVSPPGGRDDLSVNGRSPLQIGIFDQRAVGPDRRSGATGFPATRVRVPFLRVASRRAR